MPKHDFFSPKAISNRQKSIGLQKLRWYCQMCEKQCRDENGFKCHLTSDSHLRQMRLFAENPNHFLSSYSQDFERGFVEILSHRHGTKRVKANQVYQEYIADKQHIHMNATCWTSLTGFVKYLSKVGKVVADETEKGWYITYIDNDPKMMAKKAMMEQRQQAEIDEDERLQRLIQSQIEEAERLNQDDDRSKEKEDVDLSSVDIKIALPSSLPLDGNNSRKRPRMMGIFDSGDDNTENNKTGVEHIDSNRAKKPHISPSSSSSHSTPTSFLKSFMEEEMNQRNAVDHPSTHNNSQAISIPSQEVLEDRSENWILPNIVVKILNKKVGEGKLYKQKGVILSCYSQFVADLEVTLSDSSVVKIRIDQDDLETVIPKVGGEVIILQGKYRGRLARVESIEQDKFVCQVKLIHENHKKDDEKIVLSMPYEDISKRA